MENGPAYTLLQKFTSVFALIAFSSTVGSAAETPAPQNDQTVGASLARGWNSQHTSYQPSSVVASRFMSAKAAASATLSLHPVPEKAQRLIVDASKLPTPTFSNDRQPPRVNPPEPGIKPEKQLARLGSHQLTFIENKGQFDERVKLQLAAGGRTTWLTNGGIVFDLHRPKAGGNNSVGDPQPEHFANRARDMERLAVFQDFVSANPSPTIEMKDVQPGIYNYFSGSDPTKWRTHIRGYAKLVYHDVWAGIDLRFYGKGPNLEQEFIVRPGADVAQVRIAYRGIKELGIADDGSLLVHTAFGDLKESQPTIYQEIAGKRVPVKGKFKLASNTTYKFEVNGYQKQYALVVDPTLLYSTYLGGSAGAESSANGNELSEYATGVTVDSSGSAYVTGITGALDFPVTPGAFQTVQTTSAAFVTKFSPLGNALVYSTFLGSAGWGSPQFGPFVSGFGLSAIAVDPSGNAYVSGTAFVGFPTTASAYQTACFNNNSQSGNSMYLTKLSTSGDSLAYSTCIGGGSPGGQIVPTSLVLDGSGRAYIVGYTNGGLPTTAGAFQQNPGANISLNSDAFLSVLDPTVSGSAALVYSTYLGGNNFDSAAGVAVDSFGMAYVAGSTSSGGFPITAGAFQTTFGGQGDAFVAKLNPAQSGPASLIYATYLGGISDDDAQAIAVDALGNAYVAGITHNGSTFPVTTGAIQPTYAGGDVNGFVSKLNAAGNKLLYSTFMGGFRSGARGIAVDAFGEAYITGFTSGFYPTPDAFQANFGGCNRPSFGESCDAFVAKINSVGDSLIYGSYLGGLNGEDSFGIAIDSTGDAYIAGYTASIDFPVTQGAFQPKLNPVGDPGCCDGGPVDAFLTKFPLGSPGGLSVTGILPNAGGNAGTVTPTIVGSGFHNGIKVKLSGGGGPDIIANPLTVGLEGRTMRPTLDLTGAPPGNRTLTVTNADGTGVTLASAFTIVQGGAPDVRIQKVGTTPVRMNSAPADVQYVIVAQNLGNVDAYTLVSESLGSESALTSFNPQAITDLETASALSSILWNSPLGPAETMRFAYGTSVSAPLGTIVLGGPACVLPFQAVVGSLACIAATCTAANIDCANAGIECAKDPNSVLCRYDINQCAASASRSGPACVASYNSCLRSANRACALVTAALLGKSHDPNYLIGTAGVGNQRWVPGGGTLAYVIHFQNEPTATAPAAKVVITVPIDVNADLASLSLPAINLPDVSVPIGPTFSPRAGFYEFTANVDLRPAQNLFVQVDAKLEPVGRLLTWTFTSVDPKTGLPITPGTSGFLAPGAEGSVFFTLNPLPGLPTGTQISHQAAVVFDTNAPVPTSVWTNTLDSAPPISHVSPLPATEPTPSFTVNWSGTDIGAGVQDFTVYASDNGGPFTAFQTNTTATSATFTGQIGHTYGFYSIARDLVGNVETAKTAAETVTVVGGNPLDVNGDGRIDCLDIAIIKASFGKRSGQAGFDPRADVNGDGIVNIRDLSAVARALPAGTKCP